LCPLLVAEHVTSSPFACWLNSIALIFGMEYVNIQLKMLWNTMFKGKIYCWTEIFHIRHLLLRSSWRKWRRIFHKKHPDSTVQYKATIHHIVTKWRSAGLVFAKMKSRKRLVPSEEELDGIGTRLEAIPKKLLRLSTLECGLEKVQLT
jgi:hypothetical protein